MDQKDSALFIWNRLLSPTTALRLAFGLWVVFSPVTVTGTVNLGVCLMAGTLKCASGLETGITEGGLLSLVSLPSRVCSTRIGVGDGTPSLCHNHNLSQR